MSLLHTAMYMYYSLCEFAKASNIDFFWFYFFSFIGSIHLFAVWYSGLNTVKKSEY